MRSKKFSGELCVYCNSRPAAVPDHVFAREFFLVNQRDDLPQVPACDQCNNEKSQLEHHLTSVLPFGGRHRDALANLEKMVPKRLGKNARLRRELAQGQGRMWNHTEGGILVRQMTLPMEGQLDKLFALITKALLWHHWKVRLTDDHTVVAGLVPDNFLAPFSGVPPERRVKATLGGDTVSYEGLWGETDPQMSMWEFTMYGGLQIIDETQKPTRTYQRIGTTTSPTRVTEKVERLRRLKSGNIGNVNGG